MHDSVLKYIVVFTNKTLQEILLVGLNIYLTMGGHSIAYTDSKNIYIENIHRRRLRQSHPPLHLSQPFKLGFRFLEDSFVDFLIVK